MIMPMIVDLQPIADSVNRLTLQGVTLLSLDDVDSWLYAIDMIHSERSDACRQLMTDGKYSVCNIEHRVEMECSTSLLHNE